MKITIFNDIELHLKKNKIHEFLLSNKDVATEYEVTPQTINDYKNKLHFDELI